MLELAVTLKREQPRRAATQIAAVITERCGTSPHERTLQRHFRRVGLDRELAATGGGLRAFGRFQAEAPNQLWTADALHGPAVAGRKAYLFAAIDDHSRALVGYRWAHAEDTLRLEAALRAGFAARGLPGVLYVDNGSPFISRQLERCLAVLGVRLTHSKPGQPQGRGKIERVFRTVREQFLVELDTRDGAKDLEELNRLFGAWVEGVYHHREHTETGQTPMERFLAGAPPRLPSPAELREAFLWAEHRQVTKQAMVSLFGNRYQVDRHVHPHATPETDPARIAPRPSGIDYLAMLEQRIATTQRQRIAYAALPAPDPPAATQDHAATPDPGPGDATQVQPLGVGVHPATTITPDPAGDQAAGGPTTPPLTDIEPADTVEDPS